MIHKISFIIPVYNEVKTVKRAIQDILDLKIPNKELIIIDNGSTDGSVDIIKSYEYHKNIFIYLKKNNTGYGSSIKKAFEMCSGKYAYIQYADLEYDQNSCFDMYDNAEKNNFDVIFGSRFKHNIRINLEMISIIKTKPSYLATFICTFLINIA